MIIVNEDIKLSYDEIFSARLEIEELVVKIDYVLDKLQVVNTVFKTADLNYTNIFQAMKKKNGHLDDEDSPFGNGGIT